jgi:signal transduction histidine kinase/ligand-binding sensor domain-containing protein
MASGIHQRTISPRVILGLTLCSASVMPLFSGISQIPRDRIVVPNGRPVNVGPVPQPRIDPHTIIVPMVDGKDLRFRRLSTEDGLSQTHIVEISQDDQGFMWFASMYGLNRYDGYKFKVFMNDPGKPNSLSGVHNYALFKDRSGALWVGCEELLDKFDPVTETATHYRIGSKSGETFPVRQMSQDHTGMLWLATTGGLFRLNPSNGQTIRYQHDPNDPFSLSNDVIKFTGEDREGTLWVATSEGVDAFDWKAGKVTLHIPLREHGEMSFHEDRFGLLWIVHLTGGGLAAYDRKTNTLTQYSVHTSHLSDELATGMLAVLEDRDGTLWFGTMGNGILKFDRKGQKFIRYRHDPSNSESLAEDDVSSLFQDHEGNIWAGLHMMAPNRFARRPPLFEKFKHEPGSPNTFSGTMVNGIYEDRQGILWISAIDALNRVDRKTGKYTFYRIGQPRVNWRPTAIIGDLSSSLWVGSDGQGLFRFHPKTGKFEVFRHNPKDQFSLSNDYVVGLVIDHAGRLWATTYDGLDLFDPATSRFTTYSAEKENATRVDIDVKEDHEGALWIGTDRSGLQRFDPTTHQFTVYKHTTNDPMSLSNNRVNSVLFDLSGTIWVGTQDGLDKFDRSTGRFKTYYEHDGLSGNVVSCILEDEKRNLWISTNNGLSKFNPSTETFERYSTTDGLPGADLSGFGSCFKSSSGEMFFGGFSGGIAFYPDKVLDDPYIPPVVLSDFGLFGRPVPIGPHSPLHKSIGYTSTLSLSHHENMFSLEFSALSFFNPEANRYRYKLESLDRQWHEVGSNQRSVTYTTLPAGNYTFRVQGATSRGAWSEPGLELSLDILPAWWNTWWFRAGYMSLVLLSAWCAYQYRLRQIHRQFEVRLDERVGERTRIARDLHDTLLQSFQGLVLRFQTASDLLSPHPAEAKLTLDSAIDQAAEAITEARDAVEQLRSSTAVGNDLVRAITSLGESLASDEPRAQAPAFHVAVEGARRDLHPISRDEVYRIASEALRNAFRYSQAHRIEVEVHYDKRELRLRIRDDGAGIDARHLGGAEQSRHFGLRGMRERAHRLGGELTIWTEVDSGTELELIVPSTCVYLTSAVERGSLFAKIRNRINL